MLCLPLSCFFQSFYFLHNFSDLRQKKRGRNLSTFRVLGLTLIPDKHARALTQAYTIFWYESFATKLWNDFRIAANAIIITMLVCFYLSVLQYFKFNSMFVIFLFSSANLRFAAWLSASQGCKRKSSKFA